jgi:outer membrane protein OmpA-like peptidoglycan-associated protein
VNTTKHNAVSRRRIVATAVGFILAVACTAVLIRPYTAVSIRPQGAAVAQPEAGKELRAGVYAVSRKVGTAGLLQAKPADEGLILRLGDVLFTSGRADLKPGALGSLNNLVNFLGKYPDRRVAIHGYTDSRGRAEYNQGLSERRANSVKAYLAAQGIDSTRLSASGMGGTAPVAGNDSAAGRQQNRRVEVIISKPPAAVTQRARTAKLLVLLGLLQSVTGGRPLL